MFRHLPGKSELVILCIMAGLCTILLAMVHSKDTGLFFLAFPLFLSSALLGLWKSGRLRADDSEAEG